MLIPTERKGIELKTLTEDDSAQFLLAVKGSKDHHSGLIPAEVVDAMTLNQVRQSLEEDKDDNEHEFGIWNEEHFLGFASIILKGESAEIGFWIDEKHTGNGYATLAATALAKHADNLEGVDTVYARVMTTNPTSQRVLEKAGFFKTERLEGIVAEAGALIYKYAADIPEELIADIDEIEGDYNRQTRGEELKAYHETHSHFSLLDLEVGDELRVRMKGLDGDIREITSEVSPLPLAAYAEPDQFELLNRAYSSHRALLVVKLDTDPEGYSEGQMINLGTTSGFAKTAGGDLVFSSGGLLRSYIHRDGAVTIDSAGMHFINEGAIIETIPMLWDGLWVNSVTVIEPSGS